jgi:glutaredoxin
MDVRQHGRLYGLWWGARQRDYIGTWPRRKPTRNAGVSFGIQCWSKPMATKRKIEVFSAGCMACAEVIEMVQRAACPSCEVTIHDMTDIKVALRAKSLGIRSVPAVVIDGKLADCCSGRGVDEQVLRAAGLGRAL